MATSVLMANDRQTTNSPKGQLPFPQDHVLDHDLHPPIRRSCGRRRKSKGSESLPPTPSQRKKEPQRGMGVEKLERLRQQERWRKMTEINTTAAATASAANHQPLLGVNNPDVADPLYQLSTFGGYAVGQTNLDRSFLGFHGQMGVGMNNGCLNYSDFVGKNAVGVFPKELSSTPNAVNWYSQHCNACHKKKKVNGENLGLEKYKQMCNVGDCIFLGLNINDNQNQENQGQLGTKIPPVGYADRNGKQGVEVVAVHRKASSGLEEGSLLMEYEFFPSSGKAGFDAQNEEFSLSSSTTMAGFDASNCIDLSLKLSY